MTTMNESPMFFNQPGPAMGDDPTFLSLNRDADEPTTIDPQLTMPLFDGIDDKASDSFHFNSSIWDTSMTADSSMAYFGGHDSITQALELELELGEASDNGRADSASTADTSISRPSSDKSRTSSKSSITSLSSEQSVEKKRTRRPTEKAKQQQEQAAQLQGAQQLAVQQQMAQPEAPQHQPAQQKPKQTKRPRQTKKAKQSRQSKQKETPEAIEEEEENDPKRSKFLERNRLAASKCRQKKKQWMHNLEDTKCEMEKMHATLHREYNLLLAEVSEMKTQLMMHSGCNDQNIDRWIEIEATRFVQRSANTPSDMPQLSGSEAASRRQSQSSTSESLTPNIKNEINYDHMPDNMFD